MNEDLRWLKCNKGMISTYFVHDFFLPFVEGEYILEVFGTNDFVVFVNGERVEAETKGSNPVYKTVDIFPFLVKGFNRFGILMEDDNENRIESLLLDEMKCAFRICKDKEEIRSSEEGMLFKKKTDEGDNEWSKPMMLDGFATAEPTFFEKK